ncbi:hypothetical protein SLA2020_352640 [Shorea laevis]
MVTTKPSPPHPPDPPQPVPCLSPPPTSPDTVSVILGKPLVADTSSLNQHPATTSPIPVSTNSELSKSFRDTLIDGSAQKHPPLVTYEELEAANLAQESLMTIENDSDPTKAKVPKVKIPKAIWQRLCAPWKNAVIIKLLGKSINFHVLHARLLKEWRTEHEFEVIDIGMGYFIVRFATPEDCSMALIGGPYKFFNHYLAVQPWEPGFQPARAKAPKTAVWVKLHGVPSMCYQEAIVLYLASKLGKPIKVDSITLLGTREKFARVCIEVDLSQQLPSLVDLDLEELPQSLIMVEYEGLHKICFHCGEFGHTEETCRFKNPGQHAPLGNPNAETMVELTRALKLDSANHHMVFGPWMVQQRKPRRRSSATHNQGPVSSSRAIQSPNPSHVPASTSRIPAKSGVVEGHDKNNGPKSTQQNRFEVIAELMDEDVDLLGS